MRCRCSCVNRAHGSLLEVDTQCVRGEISPFNFPFNKSLRVDFQGSRVTSDGGLLLVRGLDERLGLARLIQNDLVDSRTGWNTQFPLADLFRQSAYSRLAGYKDLNDAPRLAHDPTKTKSLTLALGCLMVKAVTRARWKPMPGAV